MSDTGSTLNRDLYILEDENNPMGSKADKVFPSTILDQVYDDKDPDNKDLREILDEIRQSIATGGGYVIPYPVTSVNGKMGDVEINKSDIGLNKVNNTADSEKPLSPVQQATVTEMIENHHFEPDMSRLDNHIANHDNPHEVTFAQINSHGDATTAINTAVNSHNNSASSHNDIRTSLGALDDRVADFITLIDSRVSNAIATMMNHFDDMNAHSDIMDNKESTAKKVSLINTNNTDYDHYPSTRALTDYVTNAIIDYLSTHDIQGGMSDIYVVGKRADVPEPGVALLKAVYFVIDGNNGCMELGVCRKSQYSYYWDYTDFGAYGVYDNKYFEYAVGDGLSLKPANIGSDMLTDQTFKQELGETIKELDLPFGSIPINPASTADLSIWIEV